MAPGLQREGGGTYAHKLHGRCKCDVQHGPDKPGRNGRRMIGETKRYLLVDANGKTIAFHARQDHVENGERGKHTWYETPGRNGNPIRGLQGIPRDSLPVYNLPELLKAKPGAAVIVTEGEKAADALRERGVLSVGTVTGAGGKPRADALRPLVPYAVYLWPDYDEEGRAHMQNVARTLHQLGNRPRVITWRDAARKGDDAADYFDRGGGAEGVRELLDQATEYNPAADTPPTPPRVETFTATEILEMDLPDPRWAVWNVIPEGCTLLGGKPKIGKSWLGLGLCVAVSSGGMALGNIPVDAGPCLYLALEDNKRRMRERLRKILGDAPKPKGLEVAFQWPRFTIDGGGLEELEKWLTKYPTTRLVVVDTLARIRPPRRRNGDLYEEDYAIMSAIATLANNHQVAILVFHHLRKSDAEDPHDMMSGTLGLGGGVDASIVLRRERGQHDAALDVTGRDLEEQEYALRFDPITCTWSMMGNAEEFRRSKARTAICELIRTEPHGMTPMQVAKALDKNPNTTKALMGKMAQGGDLLSIGGGLYVVPPHQGSERELT